MVGLTIFNWVIKDLAWSVLMSVVGVGAFLIYFASYQVPYRYLPGPKRRAKYREKLNYCEEIKKQLIDGRLSLEDFEAEVEALSHLSKVGRR
jgi:hypothetical protein